MALSALANSVITSACDTKSVPWPPHSFGTAMVRKPSLEPFLMMSQVQVSRAVEIASRSSEIGRISSSANLRASICQERCSFESEKSMRAPDLVLLLGSQRLRRPAITGNNFGKAQLGITVAVTAVLADAGIVDVFLQRHIAHHAHGAEDL